MRKHVEVRYLNQNIGTALKMVMGDSGCELRFFAGLKKPSMTAQDLIRISEERKTRNIEARSTKKE